MPARVPLDDQLLVESVAREGGYEVVDQAGKWAAVASTLGMRKTAGGEVKHRYEDLLRASSELEVPADDDLEYEVEAILDSKLDEAGNTEYLVKWKSHGEADGEHDDVDETWEPRDNLACPELLRHFEATHTRTRKAAAGDGAKDADGGVVAARAAAKQFRKVVGARPASEGSVLLFEVLLADGSSAIETNAVLRENAPQILIDFYEERLRFQ